MNLLSLEGKHIVITGASSGIGRQTAIVCASQGAKLSLIGRSQAKLDETIAAMDGNEHQSYAIDITQYDKIEELISNITLKHGKIDGFVHSAGIEMTKPLKLLKPENLLDVFSINVFSGFEMSKEILKNKNVNNNSSIIFISSIVGSFGQAGKVAYSASKGALIAGAKSMSLEYASKGIRVNTILPALVKTEMSSQMLEMVGEEAMQNILKMHPLGFGSADDVAKACLYFLSDLSKWVTGTSFIIDGGYSAS